MVSTSLANSSPIAPERLVSNDTRVIFIGEFHDPEGGGGCNCPWISLCISDERAIL
jgi:hypothetical protein